MGTQMPLNSQSSYEKAYILFKEAQYKQAEEQLLQLASQSIHQNEYPFYLDVSLLLNRVYINSIQFEQLGNNLLKLNDYINEFANEEQYFTYRLHTAIFNHYYKIGNSVSELEMLFEDLYNTNYHLLKATTASYLMLVYLEMHEKEKAIELVQRTKSVIKANHFDNQTALFAYQVYTFFAYYGVRMYKESNALLSEIELTTNFKHMSQFGAVFGIAKALQIAQSGHLELAKQLFDETYETITNKEHNCLALDYWVEHLLQNGLYKDAAMYQQLHIKLLQNMYSTEISCLRMQVIEERSKQSFEHLVFQDGLTGVYNRNYYESLTKKKIKFEHYTLVIIDLDLFKVINDTGGHTKGDEAIKLIACNLQAFIDHYPDARVIRYGGDEFLLCMPYAYNDVKDAISALHKHILSQYVAIHGKPFYLSISMGIGYTETSYSSFRELFEVADAALYEAKQKRGVSVWRCIHS